MFLTLQYIRHLEAEPKDLPDAAEALPFIKRITKWNGYSAQLISEQVRDVKPLCLVVETFGDRAHINLNPLKIIDQTLDPYSKM